MKLSKIAMLAAIACASYTSSMTAGANDTIELVAHSTTNHSATNCDCGEPVCGCEAVDSCCDDGCDSGCDSACGSGSKLGSLFDKCSLGDCCLGEPWSLFGTHNGISAGGWLQMGYHTRNNALFNSYKDKLQLQQAWVYAEKAVDTSCGFDIGGRVDYLYGTDSQDTQAFGTSPRGWDNDWDNGGDYGRALPQAYVEVGYGDLTVKAGKFFTLIGYEVVAAPDNFFYSHAYTMYNSEPFTHTGALATYKVNDSITAYGGYTLGWDSGFDDNGDSFLGGLSVALSDQFTLTYATVAGRFGSAPLGTPEKGYMQSLVADISVSDNLQYIIQSDYLDSDNGISTVRQTFDINQYLIYSINDCWSVGGRFEWWQVQKDSQGYYGGAAAIPANTPVVGNFDVYALTFGVNYKPHANVIIRPEIRSDWVQGLSDAEKTAADVSLLEGNKQDQTTFGIDTIFLF